MEYSPLFLLVFYALVTEAATNAAAEAGKVEPDGIQVQLERWVT